MNIRTLARTHEHIAKAQIMCERLLMKSMQHEEQYVLLRLHSALFDALLSLKMLPQYHDKS